MDPLAQIDIFVDYYFAMKKAIHDHFMYNEDWKAIPLEDYREYYWCLTGEDRGGHVVYSEKPLTLESIEEGSEIYGALIYTQRFLPRWVYKTETHTLVSMDTQVDGNKFLGIFDNAKRQDDEGLKKAYIDSWSMV